MEAKKFTLANAARESDRRSALGAAEGEQMILLVTTSTRAKDCAAALELGTGHKTHVSTTAPLALSRLRAAEYDALAVDQSLLEADPHALETLLNRCGTSMLLYINLALHSTDRVVREVQVGLRRIDGEKMQAMKSAEQALANQLRGNLTGILLNSDLALRQKSIPADVAEKVKSVRDLAEQMRTHLGIA
jgi:hypothetical protein